MKDAGVTWTSPDPAPFRQAVEPFYKEWGDKINAQPTSSRRSRTREVASVRGSVRWQIVVIMAPRAGSSSARAHTQEAGAGSMRSFWRVYESAVNSVAVLLFTAMMVVTALGVFFRYVLNAPSTGPRSRIVTSSSG